MSHPRSINDLPPEILSSVFSYLSNDELLNLSLDLLLKGLFSSAAKIRFQSYYFSINRDSLSRLYRLSKCNVAACSINTLIINVDKFVPFHTNQIHQINWQRHLRDHAMIRLPPACVTMKDTHEAVGVKSWRECKTCNGESPIRFQNRLMHDANARGFMASSEMVVATLARCLRQFQNLKEVWIDSDIQASEESCMKYGTSRYCKYLGEYQSIDDIKNFREDTFSLLRRAFAVTGQNIQVRSLLPHLSATARILYQLASSTDRSSGIRLHRPCCFWGQLQQPEKLLCRYLLAGKHGVAAAGRFQDGDDRIHPFIEDTLHVGPTDGTSALCQYCMSR